MSAHSKAAANRLAKESSPYLLLHAANPVDWFPWGEEAFARARAEDKPIFLSVGYSTCYWCHVMERESFSSPEIARQLNEAFVCIKLDREERPDVDEIYMTATQLLTRSGGWPNSVFLTPDLSPFFAGTYFPPDDRFGRPGFPRVLAAVREAWTARRWEVLEQAEVVAGAVREQLGGGAAGEVPAESVGAARTMLARRFDPASGGFGPAPKFPSPSNLFFLLDRSRERDDEARGMLVRTLDAMARGGIHDQLAGGFHRYSTDAEWLVPHFEKMLYDNAALAVLLAEADGLAPDLGLARVARSTLDFVLAELTGPHGAFLSAIDAETDGHEGAYYTWTREELRSVLGPEDDLLASVYGFDGPPSFEGDRYVLHLPRPLSEQARARGVSEIELLSRLEPGRRALLEARFRRKRPLTDDKVLADWNGLMIGAMARCGALLGETRYREAAARAAEFVLETLVEPGDGRLLHAWREGDAKVPALLDDYAFLVEAVLCLHDVTREERWLERAVRLAAEQDARLWDEKGGGYFAAGEDPRLLFRAKAAHDGATASGNGVSVANLLALESRTGRREYGERAEAALRAFAGGLREWPLAHVTLLRSVARRPAASAGGPPVESLEGTARSAVDARAVLGPAGDGAWTPFTLTLRIRDGWHLYAAEAAGAPFVPTTVAAEGGRLRNLRYPEGAVLSGGGPTGGAPRVYAGEVVIEGEVEAEGRTPTLRLTYQACDESRCLAPVTCEVPLG